METQEMNNIVEEVKPVDYAQEINNMLLLLPPSITKQYNDKLTKKKIEKDTKNEETYRILHKLYQSYENKKTKSKINSKQKREKMKEERDKIPPELRPKRGRPPKKQEPEPEPESEPEEEDEQEEDILFEKEEDFGSDSSTDLEEILADLDNFKPREMKQYTPQHITPLPQNKKITNKNAISSWFA